MVDWAKMREIADSIGAYLFVDMAHVAGLVAAGVYLTYGSACSHVVTTTAQNPSGSARQDDPREGGDEDLYKN